MSELKYFFQFAHVFVFSCCSDRQSPRAEISKKMFLVCALIASLHCRLTSKIAIMNVLECDISSNDESNNTVDLSETLSIFSEL